MRRRALLALSLATVAALSPLAGQDTRPGIAVLPFENGGSYGQDKENFEALQKGIPGMLISELSQNPAARVVDRDGIESMLAEQNLAKDGRVDAATAARIGKLVGARYMIMPSTALDFGFTHIFIKDPKIENRNDGSTAGYGSVDGTYDSNVNIISASLSHTFK